VKLVRHPESPPHDLAIDAQVERSGDALTLRYTVSGAVGAIVLPPRGASGRSDGLWRSTCFEAFIRGAGDHYAEFNFAPSGGWAAYEFEDYRQDPRDLELGEAPAIQFGRSEREMMLSVSVGLPEHLIRSAAPLGLSAVIEDHDGAKSYWALAHADGPPDFHHADCFVAKLP
jgi:hypothetical protein